MHSKSFIILIVLFVCSCRTYKQDLKIKQTSTAEPIIIRYSGEPSYAITQFPVEFEIINETFKERYFWSYNLIYGGEEMGFSGTIFLIDKKIRQKIGAGSKVVLEKGSTYKFLLYSAHLIDSRNEENNNRLKNLMVNESKNSKNEYYIKDKSKFETYFPNYLKNQAENDNLEFTLDKQSNRIEYLNLNIKY